MIFAKQWAKSEEGCREARQPASSVWRGAIWSRRILFVFVLVACWMHADAARSKPLRLGYFPNITHAQALYGRASGEVEKVIGEPIEWISFNAGPAAIESMFVDAIDATFIGPSPTINGYIKSRGEKFVIIAGAASGGGGMIVRQDSGIAGEKDFDGKVIATPQWKLPIATGWIRLTGRSKGSRSPGL